MDFIWVLSDAHIQPSILLLSGQSYLSRKPRGEWKARARISTRPAVMVAKLADIESDISWLSQPIMSHQGRTAGLPWRARAPALPTACRTHKLPESIRYKASRPI